MAAEPDRARPGIGRNRSLSRYEHELCGFCHPLRRALDVLDLAVEPDWQRPSASPPASVSAEAGTRVCRALLPHSAPGTVGGTP